MKQVPIGIKDYEKLKTGNYYVVDKTLMIKDFLERQTEVTLVTRPRRFGKTLNMSMMANFFDITKDSKKLFKDTKIMNTKYASELNQWPTIFISFADASGEKEDLIKLIKQVLLEEYRRCSFVFSNLDEFEQPVFDDIKNNLVKFNSGTINQISNALSFLMKQLEAYYHKKVMLFIDEYDTPFIEAHVNGYYQDVSSGLAAVLHNSLKSSSSLQHAFVTGIQRVAKESIFSKLNNPVVCSVNDKRYSQYFGFTEDETRALLEYYGLALNQDVKDMYDGYHIGNLEIYNPWSIVNYADTHELIPYWVNTSSNTMIKNAMKYRTASFNQEYEQLIKDGELETQVLLETSFYEQSSTSSLWGLFINAGYLTIAKTISTIDSFYQIKIPNQEVQREFISFTEYYLSFDEARLIKLFRYLVNEKKDMFLQEYRSILKSASSFDLQNENSYHMMMLGMCVCLSNNYEIISNREVGNGRCDIILKAKANQPSFVFEFKYLKPSNNQEIEYNKLDKLADEAITQIRKREYGFDLTGKVIYIALAHQSKFAVMRWIEK